MEPQGFSGSHRIPAGLSGVLGGHQRAIGALQWISGSSIGSPEDIRGVSGEPWRPQGGFKGFSGAFQGASGGF